MYSKYNLKMPRAILNKVEKLVQKEWKIIKKHSIWGGEILSGSQIPIEAQIVDLVDVYGAF
ncbi:MAG TPA: hypothetical protein ENF81_03510 [Thermotogaceae bacterium]|nr:hypothetical protein [Thermotogaceae bacterium]